MGFIKYMDKIVVTSRVSDTKRFWLHWVFGGTNDQGTAAAGKMLKTGARSTIGNCNFVYLKVLPRPKQINLIFAFRIKKYSMRLPNYPTLRTA